MSDEVARTYIRALYNPKADHRSLLLALKTGSADNLSQVLRRALQIPKPRALLLGHPFPRSTSELYTTTPLLSSGALTQELVWTAEILMQFKEQLNRFLQHSALIEKQLISGDFDLAQATLRTLTDELGWSLWAIQSALLIADLQGGISNNRATLAEIYKSSTQRLKFLAYYCSLRVEGSSSASSYDLALSHQWTAAENNPNIDPHLLFYFRLKLNFHSLAAFDEGRLAAALARDSQASLVDRYLLLLRVLQVIVAGPFEKDLRRLAGSVAYQLSRALCDPRLMAISVLGLETAPDNYWQQFNTSLLPAIDDYTRGNYQDAATKSVEGMIDNPSEFVAYELWARAQLHSLGPTAVLDKLQTIPREIAILVRQVLNRGPDAEDSLQQILKFAYRFDHLNIGGAMFAFYLEHRLPEHPLSSSRFALSNSSSITPRFGLNLASPLESLHFIDQYCKVVPSSATAQLFREVLEQISTRQPKTFSLSLPAERRLKYEALVLEHCQEYRRAVDVYTQLAKLSPAAPMVRMDAAVGLYKCLLELKEFDRCIGLVVDTYISQDNLLAPTQVSTLVEKCEQVPALRSVSDPAFPILYYLHKRERTRGGDVDSVYIAYDRFLSEVGVDRPSELRDRMSQFDPERLRFFLRHICVLDVMDSSIAYATTEELENERIKICELLREIDPKNEDTYANEISLLQKRNALRGAIRSANRSKIYIDTTAIESSLDAPLREVFERYRTIAGLDPLHRDLLPKGISPDTIVITNESIDLHRKLFDELRSRFLSSDEHGLDSYLSVRVRHGTLAGQIRNVFERQHLATRRDSATGSYEANEYWRTRMPSDNVYEFAELNEILAAFSDRLDAIIEEVKGTWVQIRTPDLNGAYFDYEFSEEDIAELFVRTLKIDEFEVFVEFVFDVLWQRTEDNLKRLREAITGSLNERLTSVLDDFRAQVERLWSSPSDLLSDIASCRTAIQNELQIIAEWFVVERDGTPDDFDVTLAVDSSTEIVKKTFPLDCGPIRLSAEKGLKLKGRAFPHLLDVLYILMENVIKHSRPEKVESTVSISNDDKKLWIQVDNSLKSGIEAAVLTERIPELKARVTETSGTERIRREGGTGFYKLGKILQHDLRAGDWKVDIDIGRDRTFHVRVEMNLGDLQA